MQERHHVIARPEDTKWGPASPKLPPGAQFATLAGDPSRPGDPYVFCVRLQDGYSVPPHSHPMDENVAVIQGVFRLGFGTRFDRGAMHELTAGAYAMLPEGLAHNEVKGETILQFHGLGPDDITYVNAADDPSRTSSGEGIDRASPTDEEVLGTQPLRYRRGRAGAIDQAGAAGESAVREPKLRGFHSGGQLERGESREPRFHAIPSGRIPASTAVFENDSRHRVNAARASPDSIQLVLHHAPAFVRNGKPRPAPRRPRPAGTVGIARLLAV